MTIKEKLSRGRVHPVSGYSDSENMWQRLTNLEKETISNITRFPNNKSKYILQVQDKIFKMRKNPAYTGPLNLPELQPDPSELLAQEEQPYDDLEDNGGEGAVNRGESALEDEADDQVANQEDDF